jgi:hypothetical protein
LPFIKIRIEVVPKSMPISSFIILFLSCFFIIDSSFY